MQSKRQPTAQVLVEADVQNGKRLVALLFARLDEIEQRLDRLEQRDHARRRAA